MVRVHVMISGKVQGVWFRASTQQKAETLGITGWVRNTREGNVEAVFEGTEDAVQQMVAWCHHGPPLSKVTHVVVQDEPASSTFDTFMVR